MGVRRGNRENLHDIEFIGYDEDRKYYIFHYSKTDPVLKIRHHSVGERIVIIN